MKARTTSLSSRSQRRGPAAQRTVATDPPAPPAAIDPRTARAAAIGRTAPPPIEPSAQRPTAQPLALPAAPVPLDGVGATFPPANSEPIVHVTIGRIDVAAPPPAPTELAAPPSAQAPLSLGEYLRERSEGRRR